MTSSKGMLFPGPLPEPVELEDLNARLMLLIGYAVALLGEDKVRSEFERRQDVLVADALSWSAPYLRALLKADEVEGCPEQGPRTMSKYPKVDLPKPGDPEPTDYTVVNLREMLDEYRNPRQAFPEMLARLRRFQKKLSEAAPSMRGSMALCVAAEALRIYEVENARATLDSVPEHAREAYIAHQCDLLTDATNPRKN
jgi:hypothetical protein